MSFSNILGELASRLEKTLKPEEIKALNLKSCKKCQYFRNPHFCTQTPYPTRIISEFYAQGCLFFSPTQPVIPTARSVESGLQAQFSGLNWYDRNPVIIPKSYYAIALPPHSPQERFSYTVPNGKMALMESLTAEVMRVSVATSYGFSEIDFYLKPPNGAKTWIWGALIYNNTKGFKDTQNMGQNMTLIAGCVLSCETYDASTGGTCMYSGATKITEFDV